MGIFGSAHHGAPPLGRRRLRPLPPQRTPTPPWRFCASVDSEAAIVTVAHWCRSPLGGPQELPRQHQRQRQPQPQPQPQRQRHVIMDISALVVVFFGPDHRRCYAKAAPTRRMSVSPQATPGNLPRGRRSAPRYEFAVGAPA